MLLLLQGQSASAALAFVLTGTEEKKINKIKIE